MKKEDIMEKINPERREFVKKAIKVGFAVPAVVSVSMLDQKLNLSTAHAGSANQT